MNGPTRPLRALVVDDERLARELVVKLLRSEPDVEVCGVHSSGAQALESIAALRPDLVFIDIRMPGLDGLSVIRRTPDDRAPLFIVVTAFESHAVEAFDVRAFDYVLKPVDKDRFARAVCDARAAIFNRRALAETGRPAGTEIAEGPAAAPDQAGRLRLRAGERVVLAPLNAVRFFEASNQYVQVHLGDASYLLSTESLSSLEERADPEQFYRIHRGFLVNLRFIRSVHANSGGGHSVVLDDGRRLPIARRNRPVTERLLVKLGERLESAPGTTR